MFSYSTADLIRTAEEDIAAGKHLLALGLLAEAARREPANQYVAALVTRADRGIESDCASLPDPVGDGSESDRRARLATLAPRGEFGDGVGLLPPGSPDPALQWRVRLLTTVATNLYERGSIEEAVQSLMKAHLLDPNSPYVEACERLLQPALETMRKRPEVTPPVRKPSVEQDDQGREHLTSYLQRNALTVSHDAAARAEVDVRPHHTAGESRRLEALRARQDLERRKREIMQWRQASGPPGQHPGKRVKVAGTRIPPAQPQDTPQLSTFFSKLKQGRLFG